MDGSAVMSRNVAVFLDLENLHGGYRNESAGVPLGLVVQQIEEIARASGIGKRTAMVRAYANWASPNMLGYRHDVLACGIKPVQIFSFDKNVKNAADIELCVDVLQVAHESPWMDVFVIATGDGGFIPLIRRLRNLNKHVIVVSTNLPTSGVVNSLLKSVADEYHLINVLPPAATEAALKPIVVEPAAPKAKVKAAPAKPAAAKVVPSVPDLRATIINLTKQNPKVLIGGQVNASALGQLLRKTWPNINYAKYDTKTLSGFAEKHCNLAARVPPSKKAALVPTL